MKKLSRAVLALMIFLLCAAFAPQPSAAESDWHERLYNVPVFRFTNHENGIGCGPCPVYTAPYENAYRVNGNATCSTDDNMAECGFINGWLLVRYQTNNGGCRVGYIPPRYTRGKTITSHTPIFHYVQAKADATILLTDNPLMQGSRFAAIYPGQEFAVLAKYTYYGDWWYVECTVDGQVARGFIDRGTSSFSDPAAVGYGDSNIRDDNYSKNTKSSGGMHSPDERWLPEYSVWGTTYVGEVRINGGQTGDRKIVRAQPNSNSKQVTVVYPGKQYPCYAVQQGNTGKSWYGIWIEVDNAWGWVSSGVATLTE